MIGTYRAVDVFETNTHIYVIGLPIWSMETEAGVPVPTIHKQSKRMTIEHLRWWVVARPALERLEARQ